MTGGKIFSDRPKNRWENLETIEIMVCSRNGKKPCLAGVSGKREKLVGGGAQRGKPEARSFMVLEIVFKDCVLHSKINGGFEIFYIKMLVNNRMTRDCVQPGGGR